MVWLFIVSLLISFDSDFFFSRLAKYLLFFSFCSITFAFDLRIKPLILFSIIDSNSLTFSFKLSFILSNLFTSETLVKSCFSYQYRW